MSEISTETSDVSGRREGRYPDTVVIPQTVEARRLWLFDAVESMQLTAEMSLHTHSVYGEVRTLAALYASGIAPWGGRPEPTCPIDSIESSLGLLSLEPKDSPDYVVYQQLRTLVHRYALFANQELPILTRDNHGLLPHSLADLLMTREELEFMIASQTGQLQCQLPTSPVPIRPFTHEDCAGFLKSRNRRLRELALWLMSLIPQQSARSESPSAAASSAACLKVALPPHALRASSTRRPR